MYKNYTTQITERFLQYVGFSTTSDEQSPTTPSTLGQIIFARYLVNELRKIGLKEVDLDEHGYIMATLPENTDEQLPTVGFIAHIDTSPDMCAENVKAQIITNYDGKDIVLNKKKSIVLETAKYPEILQYLGQDIIVTDGTTLLGADDKAGVAAIVSAMEYLIEHPTIKHGKIRIGFTPDEEINKGVEHFDIIKFGADWAYTIDGGEIGELEYENFNAASAKITIKGSNVHPGYAKNKMLNAIRIASELANMLPQGETPEHTEGYEGFFHLIQMNGNVEEAFMEYIIRDHDKVCFENRKTKLEQLMNDINNKYGNNVATLTLQDQYYNMQEKILPVMHIIDTARQAMEEVGVTVRIKPIRGGTDGARLSFAGLPCPNIFAGGHNFHSRFEFVPIPSMEKAMQLILKIIENIPKKYMKHPRPN